MQGVTMENFQSLELGHKEIFNRFFKQDPPRVSELTFTNLFIWQHKYAPTWAVAGDCLLIICRPKDQAAFGLQPVGPGDKAKALQLLVESLKQMSSESRIERVDEAFVKAYVEPESYTVELDRDNSDYVYLAQDLIQLSGNKFHRKKNHVNQFIKKYRFEYRTLNRDLLKSFLNLQENWCQLRECVAYPDLWSEDYAVHTALTHFGDLDFQGGAILIDDKVEAFALGESLNEDTAVIHIEKANPEINGLYAAINQVFCREAWSDMRYINREQDMGIEGLRQAKESYYPDHRVQKYSVKPKF
ncbi:MAG: DUF2156 domain-containing protein [Desulfobacteraceae bacterium]|nr:MAG: DUF2156 domain-containing protein [Desulfobacteraceae bacterium]